MCLSNGLKKGYHQNSIYPPSYSGGFLILLYLYIMTEKALKKILTMTVMKEFPEIDDINVVKDGDDYDEQPMKQYTVWVGIYPPDLSKINSGDVREKIKEFSSYVLNSRNEKIRVLYYNPKEFS